MDKPDPNLEKMAALGRVTRSLIHDFNNSLASIMGHADFLIADLPQESEQHVFAENIKKAALQLQDTLHQIKTFSAGGQDIPKPEDIPKKPNLHQPRSILLVDDRAMVLNTIATMLHRHHHIVELASDGLAALDMIRKNPKKYDLLITDYTMPDLNGRDLISEIRQDFKTIPIIIMSGDEQSLDDLKKDRTLKNIFILPKPIVAEDLDDMIALTHANRK
jgi:two-component system chemotaxis response regulator CheY